MNGPRIGYLVKAFPVVSETFILNEIRAMEGHGIPLSVLALKPAPETIEHRAVRQVESRVLEAPWHRPLAWPGLLTDHLALWSSIGPRYTSVFQHEVGRVLRTFARQPTGSTWKLVRKRLRRFLWAGWAARRAAAQRIEHLHAHYATEPLRVAHLVYRLVGIDYSFTAHAKDLYQAPEARLARRLRSCRFAVSCHRDGVDTLRRLLPAGDRDKVRFIRHGLDLDLFRPSPRPVKPTPRTILAVGRLTPKKGFEDLVDACAILDRRGVEFECRIVGDGRLRPQLEARIRAAGLDRRIGIDGFIAQEDLPSRFREARLCVVPSKLLDDGNRDGVPNVALEAMACGAPVVASAVAGLPEVVAHRRNGLLTPPGDPEALAEALAGLLDSPRLAASLGRAAADDVRRLGFRLTNEPLAEEFRQILRARVESAMDRADRSAWSDEGLAAKAGKKLGLSPRRLESVESAIRRAVRPGLSANSWRPDLVRLAGRRLWDEVIKARRLPRLLPILLRHPAAEARVLDLGSGRGGLSVALGAMGLHATAVDLRYRNCAVTRLRGRRYGLDVPAAASIGEDLPFADRSFDAVACLEVLEHVKDPVAVLREIHRVLKPTGRCVVTVINRWAPFDPHYHLWGINHLPRALASRYISLRRRSKRSHGDCQTLDEMHYYTYRRFHRLARDLGFSVTDPAIPDSAWARGLYRLRTFLSQGFNTVTLVLRPLPRVARTVPALTTRPLGARRSTVLSIEES